MATIGNAYGTVIIIGTVMTIKRAYRHSVDQIKGAHGTAAKQVPVDPSQVFD
jgi:hypothetical protein